MSQTFSSWWTPLPRKHSGALYVGPAGVRSHNENWRELDPEWAALRDAHLAKHPRCAARGPSCAGRREVHHVGPKHLYPELRYHGGNLITLCEFHHLHLGHGGQWSGFVPQVRALAERATRERWTAMQVQIRGERARIWHRIPFQIQAPRQETLTPAGRDGILRKFVGLARRLLSFARTG